jgi:hypothetical protein
MSPDAVRNCLHCSDVFEPDVRHRHDQRYCRKPACQLARRAVNSRRWREQPEHKDWWRGEWNVRRVRQWRAQHPGYWKRWKRKKTVALQIAINPTQATEGTVDASPAGADCATNRVPELLKMQSPVVVGLIAQMYGSGSGVALQSAIAEVATRLFEKGRAVIGQQP